MINYYIGNLKIRNNQNQSIRLKWKELELKQMEYEVIYKEQIKSNEIQMELDKLGYLKLFESITVKPLIVPGWALKFFQK